MTQQTAQLPGAAPAPVSRFARAQRHSRRVRMLKIGVPALALLLVLVFAFWAWWSSQDGFVAEITGAAVEDGRLVMTDARLSGFTRDNLSYTLSAERAVQEIGGTGLVELEKLVARVPLTADIWADIEAATGLYDNERKLLEVTSAMTINTTNGVHALFRSAHLDVPAGEFSTDEPVHVEMQGTTLSASSMQVRERGRVIVFEGQVRVSVAPRERGPGSIANGQ
jgi:lipopolysaccharide export system protein LptC